MKFKKRTIVVLTSLLAVLAIPVRNSAQDALAQHPKTKHHRYKLIDMGTLGGPKSYISNPSAIDVNNRGTLSGWADTPVPDPYSPNCFNPDCFVSHAFQWRDGVTTDLGALPGGGSSAAGWINERGVIVGESQNGLVDPLTGFPEQAGVFWLNGQIKDLGTFGGNQGSAAAINKQGQVVGGALNTIPDPFSSFMTENFVYFTPAAEYIVGESLQQSGIQGLDEVSAV